MRNMLDKAQCLIAKKKNDFYFYCSVILIQIYSTWPGILIISYM